MELKLILPFVIFTVLCLGFVAAFLWVRVKRGACTKALILKTLASLMFLAGGIYAACINRLNAGSALVVLGLAFALIGDVVLDLKQMSAEYEKFYLNMGMISFTISSLLYAAALLVFFRGLEKVWLLALGSVLLGLAFAFLIIMLERPLKLNMSGFRPQVAVYSSALAISVLLALGIGLFVHGALIFAFGLALVLVSDLILSFTYFGQPKKPGLMVVLNHSIYYVGELMVMAYLFFMMF